jgi:hypothetical protein
MFFLQHKLNTVKQFFMGVKKTFYGAVCDFTVIGVFPGLAGCFNNNIGVSHFVSRNSYLA